MSKPVRLADYLYAQVEELAAAEKRSLANMVQVLLEQALKMQDGGRAVQGLGESSDPSQGGHARSSESVQFGAGSPSTDRDVKTDFK